MSAYFGRSIFFCSNCGEEDLQRLDIRREFIPVKPAFGSAHRALNRLHAAAAKERQTIKLTCKSCEHVWDGDFEDFVAKQEALISSPGQPLSNGRVATMNGMEKTPAQIEAEREAAIADLVALRGELRDQHSD